MRTAGLWWLSLGHQCSWTLAPANRRSPSYSSSTKTGWIWVRTLFFKWAIPGLFLFIFVFSVQLIVHTNFANDWIRTADPLCLKQLLYQLRHNHFTSPYIVALVGSPFLIIIWLSLFKVQMLRCLRLDYQPLWNIIFHLSLSLYLLRHFDVIFLGQFNVKTSFYSGILISFLSGISDGKLISHYSGIFQSFSDQAKIKKPGKMTKITSKSAFI